MLHPSYTDLMAVVNSEVEQGEAPVVNSRYSIVLATARRARQIITERRANEDKYAESDETKPLSVAVDELYNGDIRILSDEEEAQMEEELTAIYKAEAEAQNVELEFAEESETADNETADNETAEESVEE